MLGMKIGVNSCSYESVSIIEALVPIYKISSQNGSLYPDPPPERKGGSGKYSIASNPGFLFRILSRSGTESLGSRLNKVPHTMS